MANVFLAAAAVYFAIIIEYCNRIPLLVMSNGILLPAYGMTILGLVNNKGKVARVLSLPWMVVLGESSYAVYLLHSPLYFYLSGLHVFTPLLWAAYIAGLLTVSILSFFLLERPARKWILLRASVQPPVLLDQELDLGSSNRRY